MILQFRSCVLSVCPSMLADILVEALLMLDATFFPLGLGLRRGNKVVAAALVISRRSEIFAIPHMPGSQRLSWIQVTCHYSFS